jgi:hypothetical protein
MKDKTKDSVNTHLKAKEMRGEIEPTHGAQVKLGDDVAYVLNKKEAIFFVWKSIWNVISNRVRRQMKKIVSLKENKVGHEVT